MMTAGMKAAEAGPGPQKDFLALVQGGYFAVTGVWPLLDMKTFKAVTGPKRDDWLVQTVGALVGVIGGTLLSAGLKRRVTPEVRGLAVGSAAALALVDLVFVGRRRISPVYLLDAATEAALIAAWGYTGAAAKDRKERPQGPELVGQSSADRPESLGSDGSPVIY